MSRLAPSHLSPSLYLDFVTDIRHVEEVFPSRLSYVFCVVRHRCPFCWQG
uniref:Uncharacterized protein n=1 Tax=Ascaris lumbricoides TaxID=6252 RepID=A0A0M3IG17_ASCLU